MMGNLPPDGFADEQISGPPDGFADEQPQQDSILNKAAGAIVGAENWVGKKLMPLARAAGPYVNSQFGSPSQLLGSVQPLLSKGFGKLGQATTEQISQGPNRVDPYTAAAVGTIIAMAPDVASLSTPRSRTDLGQETINNAYKKVAPAFLKPTKGIPPNVSRMTIDKPSIFKLPGTSESIQGKSQNIINAIKEAQSKVGSEFDQVYAQQGISNPAKEIIANGPKPIFSKNFDQLRGDYAQAKSGDLFKNKNAIGAVTEASNPEKLSMLTDLKRALQDKAVYPAPGQQLSPSQGSFNKSIKDMAADIDEIRGTVGGGEKLALADDAWVEMKELKQRLMSSFKDPYTGQDYLNRILKGNTDWLTSGRNAGRIGAIERIEEMTGRKVLKPALEEMAASYLNNPDVMGLPSTGLKAIITSLIPTKAFLSPPNMKARGLFKAGNFGATVANKPLNSLSNGIGNNRAVENSQKADTSQPNNNGNKQENKDNVNGSHKSVENQGTPKLLTETVAREYLKKSGGDKKKARQMAIQDGWEIPS